MTTKEYLRRYRRAQKDMEYTLRDLEAARVRLTGLRGIQLSDMPKGHDPERDLSAAFVKFEEEAERLNRIVEKDLAIMAGVERSIRSVPTLTQYQVLRLRYMDGMKWDDIAEQIGKSRQWVNTVHGRALRNIRFFYEEDDEE